LQHPLDFGDFTPQLLDHLKEHSLAIILRLKIITSFAWPVTFCGASSWRVTIAFPAVVSPPSIALARSITFTRSVAASRAITFTRSVTASRSITFTLSVTLTRPFTLTLSIAYTRPIAFTRSLGLRFVLGVIGDGGAGFEHVCC
jgi:hypothetical protein